MILVPVKKVWKNTDIRLEVLCELMQPLGGRWKVGWLCAIWYVEPADDLAIEISACSCKLLASLGDNSLLVILCPKGQGTTSFTVKDGYDPYRRYILVGDQESARANGFIIGVR
jgi:hypothetical protein